MAVSRHKRMRVAGEVSHRYTGIALAVTGRSVQRGIDIRGQCIDLPVLTNGYSSSLFWAWQRVRG